MAVSGYTTLRQVVYDLLTDFKQVHANANIGEYQLAFWVQVHADRLKKLHIQKSDSGAYISSFIVDLHPDTTYLKEFDLPDNIYDFDLDRGVAYIATIDALGEDRIKFTRTSMAKAFRLYYREDETPAYDNPYFYRENNKIKLLGIDDENIEEVEVGLYTTFNPSDVSVDLDAPWDFPQDLYPILKRQILDLGTWALQVPANKRSDSPGMQEMPLKKFLSVDDAVDPQVNNGE